MTLKTLVIAALLVAACEEPARPLGTAPPPPPPLCCACPLDASVTD